MKAAWHRVAASLGGRHSRPLVSEALQGGAYLAGRYGAGVLVSMANMLVMTWWIGPHAYGVYVTAITLVAFLATLSRAGVDTYLVRCEDLVHGRAWEIGSTVVAANSAALLLLGASVIPLLARWYHSKEFILPYAVLLLNVPLIGLAGIPIAKLERSLNFKKAASIELAGQTLSLLVSMLLAARGWKVWAPVAGQLAWQGFILAAGFAAAGMAPRFQYDSTVARKMLGYGVGLTLSLRTWQLRTLVNPLIVGRLLGAEAVAFVALAIRVTEGLGALRLAAGRIAIATLSRLQANRADFEEALQTAIHWQVITLGPLLSLFALGAPWLVPKAVGAQWLPAIDVYPFIAAGVLLNSIYNLQASALFVMGRQWAVTRAYLAHVILLAIGTAFFVSRAGIAGYGWAELLACASYGFLQAELSGRATLSYRKLVPQMAGYVGLLFAPLAARCWVGP